MISAQIETSGSSLIIAALAGLYNRGGLPKHLEEPLSRAALALPEYVEARGLASSSRGSSIKARDYYFDLEPLKARKNDYVGAAVLALARIARAPAEPEPDPRLAYPSRAHDAATIFARITATRLTGAHAEVTHAVPSPGGESALAGIACAAVRQLFSSLFAKAQDALEGSFDEHRIHGSSS